MIKQMTFLKRKTFYLITALLLLNIIFSFVWEARIKEKFAFNASQPIKGITVVAPPREIGANAFCRLKDIHTEWVSFVPYAFCRKGETELRYNLERQWWGEKLAGTEVCIIEAKKQGLKVMLKPQVYIGGGWIGELDFDSEDKWRAWERSYRTYILEYLQLAVKYKVDMFCIGTEINMSVTKRNKFWKELTTEVRKIYPGQLTYSANWDHYEKTGFWNDLDYIGISGYFPLSETQTPTVEHLVEKWKPVVKQLKNYAEKQRKKILFTEYGYMSVDGCAGKAWEIEKRRTQLNTNHFAQSNAYDALWTVMSKESFWAGGFLWKWFPDGMGHEGYPEKDYSPQDKPAEKVIKKWFGQHIKE